jgi:hypothetical protein
MKNKNYLQFDSLKHIPVPVLPCKERTRDLDGFGLDTCEVIEFNIRS